LKPSYIPILLFFILLIVLIDLYAYRGLKSLLHSVESDRLRLIFKASFLFPTFLLSIGLITGIYFSNKLVITTDYRFGFYMFGLVLLFTLPKIIFIVFYAANDISNFFTSLFTSPKPDGIQGEIISRKVFITQVGLVLSSFTFLSIFYGMVKGRFNFKVIKQELSFSNLPDAFKGFKIVQISDVHIGSFFNNHTEVARGIEMINNLNPDLIVFTGDFVNNYAKETEGWVDIFSKLKAKMGKYSILGNHDYGDYGVFKSAEEKIKNLNDLIETHKKMGFQILLNQHAIIEKNGQRFSLIGVENWGFPPFPQYGDLNKAMQGVNPDEFSILLSHDPSHFDGEVLGKTNIPLTLSGHTHGMQFGVEIGDFKWSPVKYKYPRWAGLYQEKNQYLYVNRGFGYIGFPGRVGIMPEITLLKLNNNSSV
jgi:predicted MPP superfamily phosphohydrolase